MAVTSKDFFRVLKEISDKLDQRQIAIVRPSTLSFDSTSLVNRLTEIRDNTADLDTNTDSLEALITTLTNELDNTEEELANITTNTQDIENLLSDLNSLITTIDGVLDTIETNTGSGGVIDTALGAGGFIGGTALGAAGFIGNTALGGAAGVLGALNNIEGAVGGAGTWTFQRKFTCTTNGSLIVRLQVPSGQKLTSWWLDIIGSGGTGNRSRQVDESLTGGSNRFRRMIYLNAALVITARNVLPRPHDSTSTAIGQWDGRVRDCGIPPGHEIQITIQSLNTTGPDVIEIRGGGNVISTTDIVTSTSAGTGTFTEANQVNDVIET